MGIANVNKQDLVVIRDFLETNKVAPVIDRRYQFNETAEALRYLEAGHARGKVVIHFENDSAYDQSKKRDTQPQ